MSDRNTPERHDLECPVCELGGTPSLRELIGELFEGGPNPDLPADLSLGERLRSSGFDEWYARVVVPVAAHFGIELEGDVDQEGLPEMD